MGTFEVSRLFRVSRKTVLRWVEAGRLPKPIQHGQGYYWLEDDVLRLYHGQ